jgi:hypothetical protein
VEAHRFRVHRHIDRLPCLGKALLDPVDRGLIVVHPLILADDGHRAAGRHQAVRQAHVPIDDLSLVRLARNNAGVEGDEIPPLPALDRLLPQRIDGAVLRGDAGDLERFERLRAGDEYHVTLLGLRGHLPALARDELVLWHMRPEVLQGGPEGLRDRRGVRRSPEFEHTPHLCS